MSNLKSSIEIHVSKCDSVRPSNLTSDGYIIPQSGKEKENYIVSVHYVVTTEMVAFIVGG